MFGVGQRDEHTIPSEVARLAEDDGVALEVHNYGLPGWVAWQEVQYLERLLARGERYDLAVFYDGFNELLVQGTGYSADPTHLGADVMDRFARDFTREHRLVERFAAVYFSPVHGAVDLAAFAGWMVEDGLEGVRFGNQLHKQIWGADAQGV